MNEEQEEKWYNAFTREQLIERCKYLQRSCERKENSIMELEMEMTDLDTKIEKQEAIIKEVRELLNQDKASASFNTAERNALEILDKEKE